MLLSSYLSIFSLTVTGGILISAVYFLASLIFMLTIVYFRTGLALLKLARYSLTPFGQSWKNLAVTDIVCLLPTCYSPLRTSVLLCYNVHSIKWIVLL